MANEILLPDGIQRLPITKWENGHENFIHTFKENSSFKLTIPHSRPVINTMIPQKIFNG